MLALARRLALVAVVATTAACALGEPSRSPIPTRRPLPPGVVALPDFPPCEAVASPEYPCVYAGHAVVGTLHEKDGCVWFTLDGSHDEARLLWPWGYSARFDPWFVVYDNSGKVVARAGDHLKTGGWGPEEGDLDACGRTAYISIYDEFELAGPLDGL